MSDRLRVDGWQVPASTMPDDATDVAVLRVVVREGLSRDMVAMLMQSLTEAVEHLGARPSPAVERSGYNHT